MQDYEPIDLFPSCNVGTECFGAHAKPPIGRQWFHGLPFAIGADPALCFIGFDASNNRPLSIPIARTARHVLFLHAMLESKILEGGPIGCVVAHYVFRYDPQSAIGNRQSEIRFPIRERFEIGAIPMEWGQMTFRAQSDRKHSLEPRDAGSWNQTGYRMCEVHQGAPKHYYIWAWKNPQPNLPIESLTIEPGGDRFLIAAITLGHVDEWPFPRRGARDVKITLKQAADANKPFQMEVEVNRGVAAYPYALPARSADEFIADPFRGWGEPLNTRSSPAYVKIAATPSATVTVKHANEELAKVNWGELERRGKIETARAQIEIVNRGRNWVHVTVVDDETRKPIPCRVHFRSPEGIPYQPHGFHNHVNSNLNSWHRDVGGDVRLGQITYAYIDGTCQGWLPRGEVIVEAVRGFEYEPLRVKSRIEPGQRELTLHLRRWTNMNARRWFSGDTHVHFLGTQGAHREAQAEDLNVVNLLQSQWGHLFTNLEDWIGKPSVSDDGKTIVYCAQENRQHILGHLSLLGLKAPVMPIGSGGPGEAEMGGTLETTMSHWADACHAQGGTVILPHLPNPNGEPAALVATGRADAVEMLHRYMYGHSEYYRYLNCGYRLPLVGGTDKMSSEVAVGICRTYVQLPADEPFTYDNWCKALRAGRTFLSSGPLVSFTVNGARIGDTVRLTGNGGTVEVEATAECVFPIHCLQIVQEGRVVAETEEAKGARRLHLKARLKVERHTWLAARCAGPTYTALPPSDPWGARGGFAHTSPIYLAVGDDWRMFDQETAQYMLTLIEGSLTYIRETALHEPDDHAMHHHGERDHLAYLERPFHEAAEAIHRRMHQLVIPH
ncbi:MAG: CehA/McbA family metallohydrolase [Verrucomicrobia bacterium]|nr:CehA/McbA family metallohydrolase [Verrucomicrobiota bacterium]